VRGRLARRPLDLTPDGAIDGHAHHSPEHGRAQAQGVSLAKKPSTAPAIIRSSYGTTSACFAS
jgi:hypothetical protein